MRQAETRVICCEVEVLPLLEYPMAVSMVPD